MSGYDWQGVILALYTIEFLVFFVIALIRFITGDTRPRAAIVTFAGSFMVLFGYHAITRFTAIDTTRIETGVLPATILLVGLVGLSGVLMEFVIGRIFTRPRSHIEDWAGREVGQDGIVERRKHVRREDDRIRLGVKE